MSARFRTYASSLSGGKQMAPRSAIRLVNTSQGKRHSRMVVPYGQLIAYPFDQFVVDALQKLAAALR